MRLCTYALPGPLGAVTRVGLATARGILDASLARVAWQEHRLPREAAARLGAAEVPAEMLALLGTGPAALDWLREAAEAALARGQDRTLSGAALFQAEGAVRLLAPVPRPPGIANFSIWPSHTVTAGAKGFNLRPAEEGSGVMPYWKGNPDSVVGPGTVLQPPPYEAELDVECELACVVGLGGRDLSPDQATRAIAGYIIVNDVSARAFQKREMQSGRGPAKGKDFDGGNVMGPWLVTPDEVGDIRSLRLSLEVNGEELSAGDTAYILWEFPAMLSYLSRGQTVPTGQVISGGCYAGGSAMDLDRHLRPGDQVVLRITRLGEQRSIIGGAAA